MADGTPFSQYDLGRQEAGTTVVVTLDTAANVRLLDRSNLQSYKSGQNHRYCGGLVKQSPYRIVIPSTGHWFVTADLMGLRTRQVRSAVQIESMPRPTACTPLTSGSDMLADIRHEAPTVSVDGGRVWDVFVSHAGEDKEAVARPLAEALRRRGVQVWLDVFELRIGDSLRRR